MSAISVSMGSPFLSTGNGDSNEYGSGNNGCDKYQDTIELKSNMIYINEYLIEIDIYTEQFYAQVNEIQVDIELEEALPEGLTVEVNNAASWFLFGGQNVALVTISEDRMLIHLVLKRPSCSYAGGVGQLARLELTFPDDVVPFPSLIGILGGIMVVVNIH